MKLPCATFLLNFLMASLFLAKFMHLQFLFCTERKLVAKMSPVTGLLTGMYSSVILQ